MKKQQSVRVGGEILYGAKAIGAFLGVTQRQVFHLADKVGLPTFKLGQIVCSRPERLREWIAAQEAASVGGRR